MDEEKGCDAEGIDPIGRATYSPEDNKLRVYPEGVRVGSVLDEAEYAAFKKAGFKWAAKQRSKEVPMSLFETDDAPSLLPPSCVQHFAAKRKPPKCEGCSKPLGVDRSPVAGLGGWYCTDYCRTSNEAKAGNLSFDETSIDPADDDVAPDEPTPDWDDDESDDLGPPRSPADLAKLRAAFLGTDAGGAPAWSNVSQSRIGKQFDELRQSHPSMRHELDTIFEDHRRAARRRRVAMAAVDAEEVNS